jgi:LPS-assembly protein
MNQPRAFVIIFCFLAGIFSANAIDKTATWDVRARDARGNFKMNPTTGITEATNGIIVSYNNVVLSADKATLNQNTGDVIAEGDVTIKWSEASRPGATNGMGNLWRGERVKYNFKTRELSAGDFKTGRDPFFVKGAGLAGNDTNKLYAVVDAVVTTDNYSDPAYTIRARQLILVPGEYLEAEDATLYLGNLPVFYFPHYRRSLKRHPNNFEFTPGYRSLWGPYLLGTYNWYANPQLDGSIHFDSRGKKGFAGGPDFNYDAGKYGHGNLEYYFADDGDPGTYLFSTNQLPRHRQRFSFTHRADFDTNTVFKTAVRYQSDPFVVRDFFESEYRQNVQPNTFADLNHIWRNWTLDVLVQPQVNDFFETVERLPDVKLTGLRQQIGETPLFYDSESSLGYFQRRFASTNIFQPDFAAFRGDTYHQITLPQTYFGWLNFTPRVGGRFTYYSEAQGLGATTNLHEQVRGVFNTGAEISFKASRVWNNVENKIFDVNGLRHIFEPSINYVFVPSPNVNPQKLPQFDYELPSLRLLPIEYPDYSAIDSIDSQNVLRFSLRNKLQTKREGGIENMVNWALYTDWRLDPGTDWGRSQPTNGSAFGPLTAQSTFADLYSDLDLSLRSWLTLSSETRWSFDHGIREANHRLSILPNDTWSFMIGHRYLEQDPVLGIGNSLIYDSFYFRMNENWGFRMSHYFEARDGTMEEQYYTIYRDLRSWTSALTIRFRDGRGSSPDDFTIAISFSLKAFPRFGLGSDRDSPSRLVGR